VLSVIERLDELTGIGADAAQVIVAELGTDKTTFPTPGHAAAWAMLTTRTVQSGATTRNGRTGKGKPLPARRARPRRHDRRPGLLARRSTAACVPAHHVSRSVAAWLP